MDARTATLPLEHVVHIYDTDEALARCVTAFITPGLTHEAALVVATPEHRALFRRSLERRGADVAELEQAGRYVALDAETTLSRFFSGGQVDPDGFDAAVARPLRALADAHGRVSVYGEMVACLWGRGDAASALELEELWNGLAGQVEFRLCCAYPVSAIGAAPVADVDSMFGTHSDVWA
jgi:hypothetical protein